MPGAIESSSSRLSFFFLCFPLYLSLFFFLCNGQNTLSQGQVLKDGDTLLSSGGNFELGFFSPGNSTLRFVGIWYHGISDEPVVWVANQGNPVSDKNGSLTVGTNGSLVIRDGGNVTVWSSSNSSSEFTNSTAVLMDTGNLILYPTGDMTDSSTALWQSFDHPTDSYLPSMRVKVNSAMGENRAFTSWKSESDPSPGNYSMGLDPRGSPQIVIWQGSSRLWRSGHWNGLIFLGLPNMTANYLYGFRLSDMESDGSMYFTYTPLNSSDFLRFRIGWDGLEEQLRWDALRKEWAVLQMEPSNDCEHYNHCGNFGTCNMNKSPRCSCIDGFTPKYPEEWKKENWTGGCVRKTELGCGKNTSNSLEEGGGDGFLEINEVKLPDFADLGSARSADVCKTECLSNCSCYAFSYLSTIGCLIWSNDLIDIKHFESGGRTIFVRLAGSELAGKKISTIVIVVVAVLGTFLFGLSMWLLWRFKEDVKAYSTSCCGSKKIDIPLFDISKGTTDPSSELSGQYDLLGDTNKQVAGTELPLFNFNALATATGNFTEQNKLGQGGFGPVYKGKLPGGQEVAVKRLSRKSGQGLEEFKNELELIAKLQHRNLVRLLGYCIKGEEKMLIYEYMPNRSLDKFLFDKSKQNVLDWKKRLQIIEGIARGLLYLHRDSRLRIIHRDLKASNILLDEEMNPKISDFGMARIFGGNQDEANTTRVVGTYGYMSPEYAMEGLFSIKSDVYSFGVLLLEIVSGRRNIGFRSAEQSNLIGQAWNLWNDGKVMEIVDPAISSSCPINEVNRCVHVGMLCVQDSAALRPTMSSVILLLESEAATLPYPKQPTFTMRGDLDTDQYLEALESSVSLNNVTITGVLGR